MSPYSVWTGLSVGPDDLLPQGDDAFEDNKGDEDNNGVTFEGVAKDVLHNTRNSNII